MWLSYVLFSTIHDLGLLLAFPGLVQATPFDETCTNENDAVDAPSLIQRPQASKEVRGLSLIQRPISKNEIGGLPRFHVPDANREAREVSLIQQHPVMTTVVMETWGQVNGRGGSFYRPQYAKYFRCRNHTAASCEECPHCFVADIEDRPVGDIGGLQLTSNSLSSGWNRILFSANLYCEEETSVRFRLAAEVTGGLLNIYFNNQPLPDYRNGGSTAPIVGFEYRSNFLHLPGGPSEVLLEYLPTADVGVVHNLSIKSVYFFLSWDYFQCQEFKSCLSVFNSDEDLDLRGSNHRQMDCLKHKMDDDPSCAKWQTCLNEVGDHHEQKILNILNAILIAPAGEEEEQEVSIGKMVDKATHLAEEAKNSTERANSAVTDLQRELEKIKETMNEQGKLVSNSSPPPKPTSAAPTTAAPAIAQTPAPTTPTAPTTPATASTLPSTIPAEATMSVPAPTISPSTPASMPIAWWPPAPAPTPAPAPLSLMGASQDEDHCLDPRIEDPESWECSCYENWIANCKVVENYTDNHDEALCLRSNICASRSVCQSWKSAFCKDLGIYGDIFTSELVPSDDHIHPTTALELSQRELLEKRLQKVQSNKAFGQAGQFDTTQTGKCQD